MLLVALAVLSCRSRPVTPQGGFAPAPVVLVAVDGMEWNALIPLLREGRAPTLARLISEGSYGLLRTRPGFLSPALWTSVATGKTVDEHGIRGFIKSRRPLRLYRSTDRRTKAFWNILSERGRRVDTLGWFVTYPVEPVHGIMVAQTNTSESLRSDRPDKGSLLPGLDRQVYPPEKQDGFFRIARAADEDVPMMLAELLGGPLPSASPDVRRRLEKVGWALRADAIYRRITLRLLQGQPPPDLLAVYMGSLDVTAHMFWSYRPRGPLARWVDEAEARALGRRFVPGSLTDRLLGGLYWRLLEPDETPALTSIISRAYEAFDEELGRLLAAFPDEPTVILMSDHGFRPWGHIDGPPALIVAAGPNIRRMGGPPPKRLRRSELRLVGSLLDVTPTLLALLGIPPARDMDGHPMEAILAPAFPDRPRPQAVATYDTPEWRASRASPPAAPNPGDEERLEQLQALGYVQ